MKVNIISTNPATCGIGMTNEHLMRGMKDFLHTHDLTVKDIYLYENYNPKSLNPFYFIKLIKKAKDGDIIHIQYNHDCFGSLNRKINGFQNFFVYSYARLLRKKIITTLHETPDLSKSNLIRKMFYRILNFCPLHFSNHIIVMSNTIKNLIVRQDKINPKKISVIPMGALDNAPKKINKEKAIEQLNLPSDKKIITLFGYIEPNKGHDKVLLALNKLKNVHFLIAGGVRSEKGEDYKKKMLQIIDEKGLKDRVTFYGYVHEDANPLILGATDLLIYPYTGISNSLALTTAIPYDVPILTSDIQPFKEFHHNHGATRIFKTDDSKDMIKKINKILNNEKTSKRLLEKQKLFISLFNWREIARRTIEIYRRCI